jgi:hypothetical protein
MKRPLTDSKGVKEASTARRGGHGAYAHFARLGDAAARDISAPF